jgi:hypothetical protein
MLPLLLLACADPPKESAPLTCEALLSGGEPPREEADLVDILMKIREAFYPDLAEASVTLTAQESADYSFFTSSVDIATLDEAPLDREYLLLYDPSLLEDPPPYDGAGAVLVHEMKHMEDYAGMTRDELVEFALWYAQGDVSEYERATDERALEDGCGEGLIAYREWLYAHIPAEAEAQKRENYYTPEEIEAWMEAHP